jgi:hypothetical protein
MFYNFYNFKIEIENVVINNKFFFNVQKKYFTLKIFSQTE